MSKRHGAREQKKLAKQKAKRDARRKQLARLSSRDPNLRLKSADRWPITAALVPEELWSGGMGNLLFARRMPDGHIAVACFLADVYCLGIKDAFWRICSSDDFDDLKQQIVESGGPLENVSAEYFSKLVHQAADYGQSLGFPPHADFRCARLLLAGIDPSRCHEEFQFGKDGKPFYVRGPYESDERAYWIADRVRALGGNYMLPVSEFDPFPDTDLPEYGNYPETDVIESDQYHEPDVIDAPWRALESGEEEPDKGEGPSAGEGRHGAN